MITCRALDSSSIRRPGPGSSPAFRLWSGGVNSRWPVFAKLPMAVAAPVRGLNHQAFTLDPVIALMRTLNGRPTGA